MIRRGQTKAAIWAARQPIGRSLRRPHVHLRNILCGQVHHIEIEPARRALQRRQHRTINRPDLQIVGPAHIAAALAEAHDQPGKVVARPVADLEQRARAADAGITGADAIELALVARHRLAIGDGRQRKVEILDARRAHRIGALFRQHPLTTIGIAIADDVVALLLGRHHDERDKPGLALIRRQDALPDFGAWQVALRRQERQSAQKRADARHACEHDQRPAATTCANLAHAAPPRLRLRHTMTPIPMKPTTSGGSQILRKASWAASASTSRRNSRSTARSWRRASTACRR